MAVARISSTPHPLHMLTLPLSVSPVEGNNNKKNGFILPFQIFWPRHKLNTRFACFLEVPQTQDSTEKESDDDTYIVSEPQKDSGMSAYPKLSEDTGRTPGDQWWPWWSHHTQSFTFCLQSPQKEGQSFSVRSSL